MGRDSLRDVTIMRSSTRVGELKVCTRISELVPLYKDECVRKQGLICNDEPNGKERYLPLKAQHT